MKLDADRLAGRLAVELGANAVSNEPGLLASRAVDEKEPALICFPENGGQVSAALRICMESAAAVTPWGGGTAMRIGNLPRQVDVIVDLAKLNRVIEHDQANLTATVQSGITLAALQRTLASQKQFLPFDPPYSERSTVGGIVAANLNGPRRSCYGSVRDLVIGMKVALATGEHVKSGGKVVKNVAGYDMCKLFVGSMGTLGIITEVTLRMAPSPETAATFTGFGNLPQLIELAAELAHSTLLPAAVVISNRQASAGGEMARSGWKLAVWCEGFQETVARHISDIGSMAERIGVSSETSEDASHEKFWDEVRDFPLHAGRLVYRVTVPRASVAEILTTVQGWESADFSPALVGDPAAGVLWIAAAANQPAAARFATLTSLAAQHRGYAIMFAAPDALKKDVDVWGPTPPAFFLMREIKQRFDPKGLLNSGRFAGGL